MGIVNGPLLDALGWHARAVCRTVDPELFFPVGREDLWPQTQVAQAKAHCAMCPVRVDCDRYATATGQAYGIWGGMTPGQRSGRLTKRMLLTVVLRERFGDLAELTRELAVPR